LSFVFTKLPLPYTRHVTLFSTRLLFISPRDILVTTQAYHLSLLAFKYQLAHLFIHVIGSLIFYCSIFASRILSFIFKLDCILIIVFQLEPTTSSTTTTTTSAIIATRINLVLRYFHVKRYRL